MVTLFTFLFLAGLIAMIAGLFKPALFNKIIPTNSRLRILVGGVVINMMLLAMVGIFAPKVEKKEETTKPETKTEPVIKNITEVKAETITSENNLGMTPEQFRQAFNKHLKDLDIETIRPFGEFDVKKGDVRDVFQVNVSPDVSLTGSVNHDGMLRGITYIVVPNEDSQKAMMDTLILTGITSNIISDGENKSKASKVVTDLLSKSLEGIDKEKNTHKAIIGNVEYSATASKQIGLWFSIEPADENN